MNLELVKTRCPTRWRTSTLDSACMLSDHLRLPISSDQRKTMRGIYPYYGPTKIIDFINEYRVEGSYVLISEDGDHFLKYDEVPMTLLADGQFNVNNHAHLLQGNDGCLTEWIYYFYSHACLEPYITRQGAGRFKLTKRALLKLPILVPPIAEQEKIITILRCWDRRIDKTKELMVARNRLKFGLMQQLLTGKKRFPALAKRRWRQLRISEFASQKIRTKPKPDQPFTALGIRSHGKGTFLKPDFDPSKIEMAQLFEVKKNDLIVNITFAWEGAIAIAGVRDDGAFVSHRFPTYEFKTELAVPEFFQHVIRQKRFIEKLGIISPGGAGRNRVLSKKDFGKLEVLMPSVEEQRRIAAVLNACDKEIELLKKQLDALKRQKRGLMQKLLTGQIRVKIADEIKEELTA